MDDSINTFDDSTTLALDYGSMASDLKATGDAMDVTSAFAGDRNPFCPNLVVTDTLDSNSWLADPQKVSHLKNLKTLANSNARLLYGSDRSRFFDITVTFDKSTGHYGAYLICAIDGNQKPLRKAIADCPIKATAIVVDGLQKDSALLFTKFDAGDMFAGQRGSRNKYGIFELFDYRTGEKKESDEAEDETRGWQKPWGNGVNGGYRGVDGNGGHGGYKRARYD